MNPIRKELSRNVSAMTESARFFGHYRCTVLGQNADKTVNVRVDSDAFEAPPSIPIRSSSPAWEITLLPGTKCNVAFEDGDPSKPYVCDFERGSIVSQTFDGGSSGVARIGDTGTGGTISWDAAATPGAVKLFYTPPGGAPSLLFVMSINAGALSAAPTTGTLPIETKNLTGSAKLRA